MKTQIQEAQQSVAIIIVNYNGFGDTVECVESILKNSYKNFQIFVIDNGSTKKPEEDQLEYLMKHTIFIKSSKNLGFSGGNNIGIKVALEKRFDFILLLNNDTVVTKDFLTILVSAARENQNAGVVGGKIAFYSQPERLWFGGGYLNSQCGGGSHERWNEVDPPDTGDIREVTFITGCLMLIPSKVVKIVGMLSEDYFLYAEDTDYCYRVIEAGFKLLFCENTLIYHKVSASTGQKSFATQYYMTRNTLSLTRKYIKNYYIVNARFVYRTLKDVLRGRKQLKPVYYAIKDYLNGKMGQWDNTRY